VRVDFIVVEEKPYFLEINTVPGMTAESLVPKEAAAAGISLEELYSDGLWKICFKRLKGEGHMAKRENGYAGILSTFL